MQRALAVLLCLGLLLAGCTQSGQSEPASVTSGDLTIEEYPLAKKSEGGLSECRKILADRPEIMEKRKHWRDQPVANPVSVTYTGEDPHTLLYYATKVAGSDVYARITRDFTVEVVQGDQVVYTYRYPEAASLGDYTKIVQGLADWDGRWVLETIEEKVIVNGESLNDQLGYSKIFEFRMLDGKPFFFFQQNDKVRISYDGKPLSQEYDEVFHYGCCDSVDFNPRGSDRMVSFFGRRGDQWYFVDIGKFD